MSKKAELNIKEFNIDELIDSKAEYNPRTISAEQKNGLRHSIEKYGYVQNIIYNERTKTVVSGHQRLEVLKEEGYETVSVNCIDIDIEEEKKLNILMNAKTISGDFTSELNDMLKDILDNDPETFDTTSMQLLFQDMPKGEIIQADEEEDKEIVKGMDLMPYESYDAVLVVFKRRDDFMYISTKLGLGEKRIISSPSVKNKKLGFTRAIDGGELIKIIKAEKNGNEEFTL